MTQKDLMSATGWSRRTLSRYVRALKEIRAMRGETVLMHGRIGWFTQSEADLFMSAAKRGCSPANLHKL